MDKDKFDSELILINNKQINTFFFLFPLSRATFFTNFTN